MIALAVSYSFVVAVVGYFCCGVVVVVSAAYSGLFLLCAVRRARWLTLTWFSFLLLLLCVVFPVRLLCFYGCGFVVVVVLTTGCFCRAR